MVLLNLPVDFRFNQLVPKPTMVFNMTFYLKPCRANNDQQDE
ncbi:hypothetical protein KP78_19470 [Jeotgalibacillus soli]|uniref:Uncharacterized protein n=1 Tax=Jeotgalibacillus soli TaxID=889306 RepID=A0A0C2VNM2_9BACL|nr:hypothetical protein KP78_19470 [Jeotgalibacillus soli]